MNGTGEYAKRNKPVDERQIPYDLTYKRNLMKKINYNTLSEVMKANVASKYL